MHQKLKPAASLPGNKPSQTALPLPPLTVYRASAGSGKTFTLAVEYIKLLVQNPSAFRQTLAVTFTNKATEEMKMRILSQLYGIWKGLEKSDDYAEKVCGELGVSRKYAAEQAGKALELLLHNYSFFRVETIDSFFQSVLRNLAHELELTANLRVGLNDVQVEEQAVDQMIDALKPKDRMLQWLLRYIMDNIDDDRTWNVIGQIKQFGKTIFRDYYKQESKELNKVVAQEGFVDDYAKMLRGIRAKAQEHMGQIATEFFSCLADEGLSVDDFSGKNRGVCSIFLKLQRGEMDESIVTKTVADAVGNPGKWYVKSSPNAQLIHTLADGVLGQLLRRAVGEQRQQWRLFKSADLTLRHLSQLRLLNSIETQVRLMNDEANRFLLSDTQQLLHDLIDGSDSPFIYEKIGTQLEHIMIDEFQDTSTVQWKNFKVLLRETMSHRGASSLIVGDVKQSIYRWRSGDWRLLAGISGQFADTGEKLVIHKLDTNYRSQPRVIDFNNKFFAEAASQEGVSAYDDVEQLWPDGKDMAGAVEVTLFPTDDYAPTTLKAVGECVEKLLQQGAKAEDIAILVRSNNHIPLLANHLLEQLPGVNVVSDEAFRLDASTAVQLIVHALRYLVHPDDLIARAFLAKEAGAGIDGQLPEAFDAHREELSRLPLYELTEQVYAIFASYNEASAAQSAYLCAFFDKVAEYVGDNNASIEDFLRYWDENLCSTTIQSPELNGLRIISIHKSKGLEFPHVIIPFCDWRLEHNDILWCRPKEEPFSRLPLVPVDYSQKGMKGTIYEAYYDEEHQQTLVDNLNLLYVAFTRASHNLFVFGKRGSRSSRSALIEQVLPKLKLKDSTLEGLENQKGVMRFTYGSWSIPTVKEKLCASTHDSTVGEEVCPQSPEQQNPFLQKSAPVAIQIEIYQPKVFLGQSNQSVLFATRFDDDGQPLGVADDGQTPAPAMSEQEKATGDTYIQLGRVLHNVFATVHTAADIPQALLMLEQEGVIYDGEITRQKIQQLISKRLADPRVAEWFSGRWTVYNECNILLPNGDTRRPDRVMTDGKETIVVDFKFARERNEHHQQVREYMTLLSQMGMPHVKGFLWFVYSNRIIEVCGSC